MNEPTLPSAQFCATKAYESLKSEYHPAEVALAWATLGTLIVSLPQTDAQLRGQLANEVAKAAHAVAVADTHQNRLTLQKALNSWINAGL